MKRYVLLLLIAFTLSGIYAQQGPTVPMVSVTGEGVVRIVPDEVVVQARIEHTGKSAAEVKALNDQVVSELLAYLESEGISPKHLQTQYVRLNKEYNYNTKESFYSANQALNIRLENLHRYETIISGLLENGLNRIDGIEFKSSQQEELEVKARELAVRKAKEKAEDYAHALDQQVGKAVIITELEGGNIPHVFRSMEMKLADSSAQTQTIAPGELEVRVRVNVSFLLL